MLSGEDVVHVDVELGASLLELALLGRRDGDEIVVQPTLLVRLQHQAALLGHVGLVGDVGDGGDITHAAPIVPGPSPSRQVKVCNTRVRSEEMNLV